MLASSPEANDSGVQIKDVAELVLENLQRGKMQVGSSRRVDVGASGD
jgi:hypothetical protein